jgi:hypothetical protein
MYLLRRAVSQPQLRFEHIVSRLRATCTRLRYPGKRSTWKPWQVGYKAKGPHRQCYISAGRPDWLNEACLLALSFSVLSLTRLSGFRVLISLI